MGGCAPSSAPKWQPFGLTLEDAVKQDQTLLLAKSKLPKKRQLPQGVPILIVDLVDYIRDHGSRDCPDLLRVDKSKLNFQTIGKCIDRIEGLGSSMLEEAPAVVRVLQEEQATAYDAVHLLRQFFTEASEGVVPKSQEKLFVQTIVGASSNTVVDAAIDAVKMLPEVHRLTLLHLLAFYYEAMMWYDLEEVQVADAVSTITFKTQEDTQLETQQQVLARVWVYQYGVSTR